MTVRIAVLDDYQDVSRTFADWDLLGDQTEVTVFTDHVDDTAVLVERLAGFDVVVAMRERTPLPAGVLDHLPRLRLLVTTGMANAAIDLAAAGRRGITVCGTSSLPTGTAELTWGLILALLRHIPEESQRTRSGGWQATVGRDLGGSTLGVIGLGRMGVQVAKVGQAFGMDVVAWSQNLRPERATSVGVRAVTRDELLSGSDVVTIHLRLSERTRGLIGEPELRSMRHDAYLINTSRGPIVDEAALLTALREGWIAGAGLDVFDVEPLPADHPLRTAPHTVLTPHLGYVTRGTYRGFFGEAVEDIAAFLDGQPVRVL
jgi:phosphoglycerate dehydrogenase-like enzyme